jgi:hypothetical protein
MGLLDDRVGIPHSRLRRVALQSLLVFATGSVTSGCMALHISSLGPPDSEIRELHVVLQSVDLPSAAHAHGDVLQPIPVWATFPAAGWLHTFEIKLVDANGDSVPRGVLHHLKVMEPQRRELFSPLPLHLVGAGEETEPVRLPPSVGYHFEAGDSLLITAMLHNPTDHDLVGVHVEATLGYSVEGPWRSPMDVVPFFAHVAPPMSVASYDLPPGRSTRTVDVKPEISGYLLGIGGHLHRYGVSLMVEDLTEGRRVWKTTSTRAGDGTVLQIPRDRYLWSRGPRLDASHTYRITAVYDNPTAAVIQDGGMATVGGLIIPSEPWPEVDRADPEYRWYLERELMPPVTNEHQHH